MRIGVVGYGNIGKRHAENAEKLGHEVLIYDPLGPRQREFERHIYDDCEAVVIATPTGVHEACLRACIERNRHALIEKPIGAQIGTLPELLRRANDKGLTVMMGNNLRLHPCVQKVKHWLAENLIGEVLWAQFTCATESSDPGKDGVILNTGAHEVDLALYFFGPARCATAWSDNGAASFVLLHDSGVRSSFYLDNETPHRVREFWIAGTEKNIGVDLDGRRASLGPEAFQAPGTWDDDYRNLMTAFVDRIEGRFAPGATGDAGLACLRVLLDIKRKAGVS